MARKVITPKRFEEGEPWVVDVPMGMSWYPTVGIPGSKFLIEIRDNKRIMGIRCPSCKKVFVPARMYCPTCADKMEEWVPLSGKGTLTTYTTVHYKEYYHPADPPIIYGIIQLDGADTGLAHFLGEADPSKIKIGMRLEPVFKEERVGDIRDIKYFRPIS